MASAAIAITQTLTANTATDDSLTSTHEKIEITNHTSSTVVYVSIGATAPTVAGNDFVPVLGGVTRMFPRAGVGNGGSTRVRLISAGTPTVTITALL